MSNENGNSFQLIFWFSKDDKVTNTATILLFRQYTNKGVIRLSTENY